MKDTAAPKQAFEMVAAPKVPCSFHGCGVYSYRRDSNMPTALNTSRIEVRRVNSALAARTHDRVAIEDPLEIQIRQERKGLRTIRSVSVTMRTPGHDEELAIVKTRGQCANIDMSSQLARQRSPDAILAALPICSRLTIRRWDTAALQVIVIPHHYPHA